MIVMFAAVLFAGCMMEKPTARNYRKVLQMEELTPITVAQLKQMIAADTTHYKVVVLTSSCCGPCHISMRDVYPRKMAECDSNRVRWYFIEERYSTAQYMDKVFANYHIDAPRYWINDTLPQYRPLMVKKKEDTVVERNATSRCQLRRTGMGRGRQPDEQHRQRHCSAGADHHRP